MTPSTRSSTARRKRAKIIVEVVIDQYIAGSSNKKPRRAQVEDTLSTSTIDVLPNEVLVTVLGLLSYRERRTCQLTCKRWNSVILSSPTLWMDPPRIKGSLPMIVKRMTGRLGKLSSGGRFRALELVLDPTYYDSDDDDDDDVDEEDNDDDDDDVDEEDNDDDDDDDGDKVDLSECFPTSTLQEIRCTRFNSHELDGGDECDKSNAKLWHCITTCPQLKVLQWRSKEQHGRSLYSRSKSNIVTCIDYDLKATPLAACKLEELTFDAPYEVEFDDCFFQIISQVKRLDISVQISASQLESIFDTIKDVVEEFTFTNYTDDLSSWNFYDELEAKMLAKTVEMPKLKKFNAAYRLIGSEYSRIQLPSPYQIRAPQVTSLSFLRPASIDWVLIGSCRNTLESLCVGTGGVELPDRLQQELFNMPSLMDLSLDLTNDSSSDYRCTDGYFFSTFWDAIDQGDTGRSDISIQNVLPKLKSLTIVHDATFTFARFMGLLKLRQRLGLSPIESLTVWFEEYNDKNKLTAAEIDEIKSRVPKVELREGKEICNTGLFCDVQCHRGFL